MKSDKEILFNSKSGFFLNTHQKKIKEGHRDFSDILEDPFQIWLNSMDMEVI